MIDDDTARRKRAWAGCDERPWSFPESDIRWAMSLSTCSVETTAMLNYLAGAREEAKINEAEIAALQNAVRHFREQAMIDGMAEVVFLARVPGDAKEAVIRALENKP